MGPSPTDRGNAGAKRSLLVVGQGGPLNVVMAGANVRDTKLLEATLDATPMESGTMPTEERPQNLCLNMGYDNPTGRRGTAAYRHLAHIRRSGEEKLDAWGKNLDLA